MGCGGGSSDSTMFTNLIPTYIPGMQDLTVNYMANALALSINTFKAYPSATYAVQDTNELNGITAMALRGSSGSPIEIDAETYLQALYSGGYIQTNPRLDLAFQKGIEEILQQLSEYV